MSEELTLEERVKNIEEVLPNFATVISDCSINLDIVYDLLFAIVRHSKISIEKDEKGNITDIEFLMPNINQEFLTNFAQFVFDLKNSLKDSKVVTSEEIIKITENKIDEMLGGN